RRGLVPPEFYLASASDLFGNNLVFITSNGPEGQNRYDNPELLSLQKSILAEADSTKRQALMARAMEVLVQDPPIVYIVAGFDSWMTRKEVNGFKALGGAGQYGTFDDVWLSE